MPGYRVQNNHVYHQDGNDEDINVDVEYNGAEEYERQLEATSYQAIAEFTVYDFDESH